MKLKVKILNLQAGKPIVILHRNTADKLSVNINDRIVLSKGKKNAIAIVDLAIEMLKKDEIAVSNEIVTSLSVKEGQLVEISLASHPQSTHLIYKKLECNVLKEEEIKKIISDIVKNALTEPEIAYFVSAIYKCGMSDRETEALVSAVAGSGSRIRLRGKIVGQALYRGGCRKQDNLGSSPNLRCCRASHSKNFFKSNNFCCRHCRCHGICGKS